MDFTPEMEVLYMLFERCHTKNRKRFLKQHVNYLNFRNTAVPPCTAYDHFTLSLNLRVMSLDNHFQMSSKVY